MDMQSAMVEHLARELAGAIASGDEERAAKIRAKLDRVAPAPGKASDRETR